jgi:hypothetical protein
MYGACIMHGEMENFVQNVCLKVWKKVNYSEVLRLGGSIILKFVFRKSGMGVWIEFVCLRTGTDGGLL